MLIEDGYTEELPGFPNYRIRRFLSSERRKFCELAKNSEAAARQFLVSHISHPDGSPVSIRLVPQEVAEAAFANPTEAADAINLRTGMRLMLSKPLLAVRDCGVCKQWWFDEDTGKIVQYGGVPTPRPEHALTMCQTERGCDRGTPDNLKAFNDKNKQAFEHWVNWRAVGCPAPHDAIIRRNWMWFETLERHDGLRKIQAVRSRTVRR